MTKTLPVQRKTDVGVVEDWRESFLQRILVISAIIGLFALIFAVLTSDDLVLQSVYIGVYAVLVGSIIIRMPYMLKVNIFIGLPLILGISSLSETGIYGDSLFFFLAFVTFAALFIGPRGGLASVIISELVLITVGLLLVTDRITLSDPFAIEGGIGDWFSAAITHLMIALVVQSGIRMLNEEFIRAKSRNEEMLETVRKSQSELENHVVERTKELVRKTRQMEASTIVAHQAASIQELSVLLESTVELIAKKYGYYHVAIFLVNPRGDFVNLQASSSDGGKRLIEQGYRLRIGTEGIVGFVAAEKKPRIALDVGEDAFYFDSPDLPNTRSELALPLIVHDKVIGVLDFQSAEAETFQYDEIDMFQTLADQIAVAIENARLLTESQMTISQLEIISNENTRRNWQTETATHKPTFHYSATGVRSIESSKLQGNKVLSVPLVLRGEKIGKISLSRKDEFLNWTKQEEAVAHEIASQTALALENIRLVERTRQHANREQAIANMTARIRETLDLDTVLRTSARELQSALNLEMAEVRLIQQESLGDDD